MKLIKTFLFLFILSLLLFSNSFNNKFLIDDYFFLSDPTINNPKLISSQWIPYHQELLGISDPSKNTQLYYRPLAHIIPAICFSFFGNNYWSYHLFNLTIFIFSAFLICYCIERITQNYLLALLSAIFYLIHPINGIIVNYITASIFAFQTIFMIGTILLFWESIQGKGSRFLYFLSLLCFIAALLCHETSIMTPFYLIPIIFLVGTNKNRNFFLSLIPFFLILTVYLIFRIYFVSLNEIVLQKVFILKINPFEYIASIGQVLFWYLSKLIVPYGIVMMWAAPITHTNLWLSNLCVIVLILSWYWIYRSLKNNPVIKIYLIWFYLGFLPLLFASFSLVHNAVVIEPHWFIFSVIGFFVVLAQGFLYLSTTIKKWQVITLLICVIFLWGETSYSNNLLWKDERTYTTYWSNQVPQLTLPRYFLAHAYVMEGRPQEAARYYTSQSDTKSNQAKVLYNLATMKVYDKDYQKAQSLYQQSLDINPSYAYAYYGLALVHAHKQEWDQALKFVHRAFEINPQEKLFMKLLTEIYAYTNDRKKLRVYALLYLEHEHQVNELIYLGDLMQSHEMWDLSIKSYLKAIDIDPKALDAYFKAGELLVKIQKPDQAIHIWEMGAKVDPTDLRFKKSINQAAEISKNNIK